jgi:hypothetical protein
MSFFQITVLVSTTPEGLLVVPVTAREYLMTQLASEDLYDEKWLGALTAFSLMSKAQSFILLVKTAPAARFLKLVKFLRHGAMCKKILN